MSSLDTEFVSLSINLYIAVYDLFLTIITKIMRPYSFYSFSYGVLVGTGAGLSFPPTVYIVTSYFVRLRGLANGICISGSAFGSIILPPILRYLLEEYGYRGAILIMGGITLNTWVAALFYEPVESHMKRIPKDTMEPLEQFDDYNDVIDEEDEGITLEFTKQPENVTEESASKSKFVVTLDDALQNPSSRSVLNDTSRQRSEFSRSISAVAVQNCKNANEDSSHRQRKISTPVRGGYVAKTDSFVNQLSSTSSLYAVPESRLSHASRLSRLNQHRSGSRPPKRSTSTSSFQYVSTPYHGSTLSFQPEEFTSHLSLKSIASSINPIAACSRSNKMKSKFLDLTLLKDPVYLVILISNSTNAIGYTNFIILLPTFATTLGFDKNLAAYLLSIVSVFDLVGRIGGSAMSDWTTFVPKTYYFVCGLALSGLALSVLPFATTYATVGFWCGLFGLASGTYVGITAVIMADMLGTERLTSSYGISLFVNGIVLT